MTNNTINNVPRELKPVLAMILNALDRDAADGKQARAEMAAELRALLSAPSPANHVEDVRAMVANPSPAGVYSADPLACPGCASGCFRCASPAGADGLDVVSNWVLFDAEADKPYIKKMLPEGFLAFFDCEEDARRAKANNPGTDYKRIDRVKAEDAQAIIDGLRGENEALQAQVKVLQSDANSWQSGYDEGRRMGGKHCALTIDQQAQRIGELEGLLRHAQKQVPTGSGLHMRIDAALSAVCAAAPNIATTSEHSSQPERDPCPMCIKGGICNTPTCGRLLAMPKAY